MIQLPPNEFSYGKYCMASLPWKVIHSTDAYYEYLLAQNIIGYCDSMECEIRPRPDDVAVMFEDDDGQFWSHVPKDVWKEYMRHELSYSCE